MDYKLYSFKKVHKIGKMKLIQRFMISALVVSIALALGNGIEVKAEALDTDIVTFEDANLEAAVRSKLSKPSGDITVSDMKSMTGAFDATNKNILSLRGIEFATRINSLLIGGNKISDITPLKNMINLNTLSLFGNQITDITPLKNMTNLKYLYLQCNQLEDVAPLVSTKDLVNLFLDGNNINNIIPLKNMTKLKSLSLTDNQIEDISPLMSMMELTYLFIDKNNINDITPLKNMTKLNYLNLKGNQIKDITPTVNMSGLTYLLLENNRIASIPNNIGNLTNLEYLDMRNNKLIGQLPESLNNLVNLKYWDGALAPDIASYTSFAGNQLTGTVPSELKTIINNEEAFNNNLFEGEPSQKQLTLKQPTIELNLSLGEVPTQNALQSLVELTDGANKSKPLYELELVPIDNTFIDPIINKTLKPGTTTAYIKIKGVSNTNSYVKTLFPITINISDKLGSNKEINVSFSLQESLEITMNNTAINFGQVSSNGGEKQNANFKVTSSLPYSVSFIGLSNFIGANDNSHVIPIEKLSLKLDTLESKALSLSKVNYISNAIAGIDKTHTLEFIMGNTLGYVSDSYSTQVQIVVENL